MLQSQHAFKQVCVVLCRWHRMGASPIDSHTHGWPEALAKQAYVLGNRSIIILSAGVRFTTSCYPWSSIHHATL